MDFLSGQWSQLNHMQLGKYAEYLVTLAFTLHGCDVYSSEVDDRGVDLVVRSPRGVFHEIQVKSVCRGSYVFLRKDKFELRENLWAVVVRFVDGEVPTVYLMPAMTWLDPTPPFTSREYEGRQSAPEWGLSLAKKHMDALAAFEFGLQVGRIRGGENDVR